MVDRHADKATNKVCLFSYRGLTAYAETCPQYLVRYYDNFEEPGFAGAK